MTRRARRRTRRRLRRRGCRIAAAEAHHAERQRPLLHRPPVEQHPRQPRARGGAARPGRHDAAQRSPVAAARQLAHDQAAAQPLDPRQRPQWLRRHVTEAPRQRSLDRGEPQGAELIVAVAREALGPQLEPARSGLAPAHQLPVQAAGRATARAPGDPRARELAADQRAERTPDQARQVERSAVGGVGDAPQGESGAGLEHLRAVGGDRRRRPGLDRGRRRAGLRRLREQRGAVRGRGRPRRPTLRECSARGRSDRGREAGEQER